VTRIEHQTGGAFNSRLSHLFVHYSRGAPPGSPRRLVLKQNIHEAWGKEAGMEEVKFYQLVASLPDHPPVIVPCYAATYDEQTGGSFLLLHDLSETHRPPITRDQQISIVEGVPRRVDIEAVIDTLAQIHTYWWEHPEREANRFAVGYWTRNADRFAQYLHRRKTAWDSLRSHEHAWFPDDLSALYERVFVHLPGYWEQYLKPRFHAKMKLTLVHGDAYFANFLCPKRPGTEATYLLDWQSPTFDIGGYDLANLCATFWTSQQRHENQREETMLRRYHTVLQDRGVDNYSWDELTTDYKTGLIFWLFMPVQDRYDGAGKEYWWPKMQCLVAAFQDWGCEKLLGI
jgi:thiamine kinase-like enzyme